MRELCYFIQAIGVYAAIDLFITIDLLFLGLCLYIVAMYKELQRMLRCIDINVKVLLTRNGNAIYYRRSLCECIEIHLAIIRYSWMKTLFEFALHILVCPLLAFCSWTLFFFLWNIATKIIKKYFWVTLTIARRSVN